MLRFRHVPIVFTALICLCGALYGQQWSGILDPSRAIDWSSVGASAISASRAQCVTSACTTVSNGTTVTAASINAAIASAPANTYVQIPAGTFTISAAIVFQNNSSNVTLRGAGANSTFLVFTGSSASYSYCSNHNICVASADTNNAASPSNSASWTGGYSKGSTSITLSSVNNLAVGNPIVLDQIDNQSDNGGLYIGCEIADGSSACYSGAGPNSFERGQTALTTIRGQQQIVTVTSISGTGPYTVGISPGLYAPNWNSAQSPGAWWATSPVSGVGIENMSIDNSSDGSPGIYFFNAQNCWVKGVREILTSSPGGSGWGQVTMSICNHCTVRDSYFYGNVNVDNYVIAVDIASDLLVENNISQFPGTFQFYNSDCEGCVAGYNYSVGSLYSGSSNWFAQPSDYHGVDLFSLAEGNIGGGVYADSFHGTHAFNTDFRNRFDGHSQNNGSATSSNTLAAILNPGTRFQNLIGNVLGTPGYHTNYKYTPGSSANYDLSVIGAGVYPSGGVTDQLTNSTTMFWGNWDAVSKTARWCGNSSNSGFSSTCASTSEVPAGLSSYANAVPSSTSLPASFYLSGKPSWWPSGKAWPPIGPDVTGGNVGQCSGGTFDSSEAISSSQCTGGTFSPVGGGLVVSLPAMDCYLNTMKGAVNGTGGALTFDPSACYSASGTGTTPPSPPQNVNAVPR